ncbi:hypothetical protein Q3G72_002976 [Acer saccharum]|nr:hypothetical protein Q3G72_002976 [Acer saccharum]
MKISIGSGCPTSGHPDPMVSKNWKTIGSGWPDVGHPDPMEIFIGSGCPTSGPPVFNWKTIGSGWPMEIFIGSGGADVGPPDGFSKIGKPSGRPTSAVFHRSEGMKNVHLVLNWGGEWKNHHGEYWYEGRRAKAFAFSRDSNYDQLLDKVYNVTGIDRDYYRVSMTTLPQTFRPSMPIEIVDDEDVALLLRRENVDPLVCISVEEIGHESPEMKPKPPQSSHNLHVNTMHELQRSDVHNMAAHLDDIGEGLTPVANIDTSPHSHLNFRDTTGNQHIPEHDETEPLFNYNREAAPNRYDEQFAHVQRLVPPPCAFYSINSGEVAPRPVTMRLEVGELFPSKKQLQSHVGSYALTNGFQIRVFKSDTTRYQVRCIVEDCNWRLRAAKVHNSDYFQIRKFDNQHTCSTEAQFPHQRQASARVIGEHIQEKFRDHRLYKPKEIIHDMQREFGISCNYHKGYRARHIALEEVQGTPVESYSILPSYLYMLEQANPGTVTDLHTDSSNRFMYMFFCLKACIDGFLSSIRPVIVIDGTFLKGPHRGVLFVAVCMDGNEQIFPLAFGVGDSETNEAWEWFLTKLHKAVGEVDDLVIVSDRKALALGAGMARDSLVPLLSRSSLWPLLPAAPCLSE